MTRKITRLPGVAMLAKRAKLLPPEGGWGILRLRRYHDNEALYAVLPSGTIGRTAWNNKQEPDLHLGGSCLMDFRTLMTDAELDGYGLRKLTDYERDLREKRTGRLG